MSEGYGVGVVGAGTLDRTLAVVSTIPVMVQKVAAKPIIMTAASTKPVCLRMSEVDPIVRTI